MHSVHGNAEGEVHDDEMSTRVGIALPGRFSPRLVFALAKVALIGMWEGRTFLDDDADLSDVADFSAAEAHTTAPTAPVAGSMSISGDSAAAHSVAA